MRNRTVFTLIPVVVVDDDEIYGGTASVMGSFFMSQ
jgi:hypothetical protein